MADNKFLHTMFAIILVHVESSCKVMQVWDVSQCQCIRHILLSNFQCNAYDHPLHVLYKQRNKLLWRTPKKTGILLYIDPNCPSRPNPGKNKHNCRDSVDDNGRIY
jgi:hypothetical protein